MEKIKEFFEKSTRINLLLFLCSFLIYFLYFHSIFFNINSTLSSITSDSLKNYYTYVYHVKNDPDLLHFTGMNYPYGEHVIYTDCQPILTFILRALPFTHDYLIGIMHSLLFFSFIISPLILNKLFRLLDVGKGVSFFCSLAIALLAPQFLKINAGHFALAYGCLIPLSLLFTLQLLKEKSTKHYLLLFVFNSLLFLLHPYLGFCLSLFSLISLFSFELLHFKKQLFFLRTLKIFCAGFLPLLLFKLFMTLTDQHANRTNEPYGAEVMVENPDSILSPEFGPFQKLMELFLSNRPGHFEGHTYLGFFTLLLLLCLILILPFHFRKIQIKKETVVLLFAGFVFLLISFGVHLKILNQLHLQSSAMNQFRAVCRFAWIFYYVLPIFLISTFYSTFKTLLSEMTFNKLTFRISLLFFCFNLLEANSFFTHNESVYWKYRNFFRESQLNPEEIKILSDIRSKGPQAIMPLPLFHGGSEMYERLGSNNSMLPSMIYSYHANTPIISGLMSRTSVTETENIIGILNSYKKDKAIDKLLNDKDFFIIKTKDALLPDEKRLAKYFRPFAGNDSLSLGYVSKKILLTKKFSPPLFLLKNSSSVTNDSSSCIYISSENRKPFQNANMMDYEKIYDLHPNRLPPGNYLVSFHFYYLPDNYRSLSVNLIIEQKKGKNSEWTYNVPVRVLSGFYQGFGVFEYEIVVEKESSYTFMLKGLDDRTYRISDFLLHPEETDVKFEEKRFGTSYNNFPE
ncbi:hypothetical protein CNR22_07455 [Sphingobacteriaceae bacterium]|nr:hypothetical protein CNR22_07455 [Sphingobacteriaceae bacterium]